MFRKISFSHLVVCFICLLSAVGSGSAQETAASQSPAVTAAVTAERVRFTAPSTVQQIRLEVYNAVGVKLFDNEVRGGNVLDWHLQDGQAEPLADGAYLCLVTVKYVSGRLSQKLGALRIEQGLATIQPAEASQMSAQQAQAIGPVEAQASLTVLGEAERQTATVIAHTGSEGQLVRGSGALSFRLGDFYRGQDEEQMRLTAEGKLGLGVSDPQAKLDVAGQIRTSEGVVFPDGSIQTTAYVALGRSLSERSQMQRDAADRRLAEPAEPAQKNSAGGLGPPVKTNIPDDLVVSGNLIFTPPSPQFTRDITMQNNNGGLRFFGAPTLTNSPAAAAIQFWGNNNQFFPGQLYLDSGAHDNAALIFRTATAGGTIAERMRVTATGNVGIGTGTAAPLAKLDTRGDVFVGLTAVPDNTTTPGNNIYVADDGGGDARNSYRIDSYNNNFYFVARSGNAPGNASAAGVGIIFRTAPAGSGEFDRVTIDRNGNVGIGITTQISAKLEVVDNGLGVAVSGKTESGTGVYGSAYGSTGSGTGTGVLGVGNTGPGVVGTSISGNLFEGHNSGGNVFRVRNDGQVRSDVGFTTPAADFAEMLPAEADLEAGDVLVIGRDGKLARSTHPRQTSVAGVYSTKPGFIGGQAINSEQTNTIPLAVVGIVPVKVTTENGPVRPGDLLTSSSKPGHAMRADARPVMGTVIGKALGGLRSGSGVIQMLAILQ